MLFFIFADVLGAYHEICEKEYRVSILPLYIHKKSENREAYGDLSRSIPKLLNSYLRSKYWINKNLYPSFRFESHNDRFFFCDKVLLEFRLEKDNPFVKELDSAEKDITLPFLYNLAIAGSFHGLLLGILKEEKEFLVITWYYVDTWDVPASSVSTIKLKKNDIYQEENFQILRKWAGDFTNSVLKRNTFQVTITSSMQDYYVYVDGISYGKNTEKLLLPSPNFEVEIFSASCSKKYLPAQLEKPVITFACEEPPKAKVEIRTEQEGVHVYLDEKYYGKTPLSLELPQRVYRLRLSREEFLDSYHLLDIRTEEEKKYYFSLRKGDNEAYYYRKNYAVSGWDYYDLSWGFAVQSLIFLGGWVYANVQKEKVLDSLKRPELPDLFAYGTFGIYEWYLIEKNRKKAFFWFRQGQVSAGLGVTSLLASGYFLYRAIMEDEKKGYRLASFVAGYRFSF